MRYHSLHSRTAKHFEVLVIFILAVGPLKSFFTNTRFETGTFVPGHTDNNAPINTYTTVQAYYCTKIVANDRTVWYHHFWGDDVWISGVNLKGYCWQLEGNCYRDFKNKLHKVNTVMHRRGVCGNKYFEISESKRSRNEQNRTKLTFSCCFHQMSAYLILGN